MILEDWAHIVPGYFLPNWTRWTWYEKLIQKPVGAPDLEFSYADGKPKAQIRPGSEGWIILGWGGSISHVDSWLYSGIIEALDRLFEKWPGARLKFCGHEQRINYILDRWGDRVIRQGGMKPEDWPSVVASFDIGLAPLDMRPMPPMRDGGPVNSYDERRSWLKAAEYLTAGVPWVASRSRTYDELARWGTLVDNTPDAWFEALDEKVSFLAHEKDSAWERRRWAERHMTMEANANRYGEIFGRILAEAHVRLGARLPGITYVAQKVAA